MKIKQHHYSSIVRQNPPIPQAGIVDLIAITRDSASSDDARKSAREKIMLSCLSLVLRIARDYEGRGLDFDDLVSEGQFGLIRAIEIYDPKRGYFGHYAGLWINSKIRHALFFNRGIRVSSAAYHWAGQYRKALALWRSANGKSPEGDEVFDSMGLSLSKRECVRSALAITHVGSESLMGVQMRDASPDVIAEIKDEFDFIIGRMQANLTCDCPARTIEIFLRVAGYGESMADVGRSLGITRSRVDQIVKLALVAARNVAGTLA